MIRRNRLAHQIALNIHARYKNAKNKRGFYSRVNKIITSEYLDVSQKPDLNVVIIVIDSLRNSHLSCQGYFRETTPFLDSLGSRFTAISASSWTYPSVASILTGLYPHNHNAIITGKIKSFNKLDNFQKLRDDILTLPEILFLLGYRVYFATAIDLAFYPFRGRVIPTRFHQSPKADDLISDFMKWIVKHNGERFLGYLHLGDLHMPLNPPDYFRNFFGAVKDLPKITIGNIKKNQDGKSTREKLLEYRANTILLYDNTLRYVDSAIERFVFFLKDAGLIDHTILIVTGDHGDEFGEHANVEAKYFYDPRGYYGIGHGHNVFNEIIEVPLLISVPVPDRECGPIVSTVDIVPTVMDSLGVNHRMRFDGRNILVKNEGERSLLSESSGSGYEKKALVTGRYKLIYSNDDGVEWLFDLENDPEEQHPIKDKEITSIYVNKLLQMLREDEKRKIGEIARKVRL